MSVDVQFKVNGKKTKVKASPMARLLDVLREELQLTGTKEGCGEGECGACSVILDGQLVNSCLVPIAQCEGSQITTIEGIGNADRRKLHPLQKCFVQCGGAQCGICTPGMIVASYALLKEKKRPNRLEIRNWLAGNLCRCTGYEKIIDAVEQASRGGRS